MERGLDATTAQSFRPEYAHALGTGSARPGRNPALERSVGDGRGLPMKIGLLGMGLGLALGVRHLLRNGRRVG